jgi:hypothetical protein
MKTSADLSEHDEELRGVGTARVVEILDDALGPLEAVS